MIRLVILSGRRAGEQCRITQFPCAVGRSAQCQFSLEEPGVWDRHVELLIDSSRRFWLRAFPDALVTVNGHSLSEGALRNGDLIELGAVRLQFWLGETEQRGLAVREAVTWTVIALLSLGQIGLIFWLLR